MVIGDEGVTSRVQPAFEGDVLPLMVSIGEELRTACTRGLAPAVEGQGLPRLTRLAIATMEPEHADLISEVEGLLLWSITEAEPDDQVRQQGMMELFGLNFPWRLGPIPLSERRGFAAAHLGYAGGLLLNRHGEGEERRIFRAMRAPLTTLAVQHGIRD